MKKLLGLAILICVSVHFAAAGRAVAQQNRPARPGPRKAVCVVAPTEGNKCHGTVTFEVAGREVNITASISGLTPNQKHAIHIHEFGDVTDLSGKSAGGHYNPESKAHGLPPASDRHAGDLGNLEADADGKASFKLKVDNISLGRRYSVLGRAIVIHAMPDDGGQPTGNAGARIGFGVIGIAKSPE